MNLQQILALSRPSDTGGVLGYRANLATPRRAFGLPEAFVPGFSHGNRNALKRKKKRKSYTSNLQRQAHDLLTDNHIVKKRKFHSEHELHLQKGRVEDFLARAYAGKRAPQERRSVPDTPMEDTPAPKAEKMPEYEVDVSSPAPMEEEKTEVAETPVAREREPVVASAPREQEVDVAAPEIVSQKADFQTPEPRGPAVPSSAPPEPLSTGIPDRTRAEHAEIAPTRLKFDEPEEPQKPQDDPSPADVPEPPPVPEPQPSAPAPPPTVPEPTPLPDFEEAVRPIRKGIDEDVQRKGRAGVRDELRKKARQELMTKTREDEPVVAMEADTFQEAEPTPTPVPARPKVTTEAPAGQFFRSTAPDRAEKIRKELDAKRKQRRSETQTKLRDDAATMAASRARESMFKQGMDAVRRKMEELNRKERHTAAPGGGPPPPDDPSPPEGIPLKKDPPKLFKKTSTASFRQEPKPAEPMDVDEESREPPPLQPQTSSTSFPVKKPKRPTLVKKETSASFPYEKPKQPKPPKQPKLVKQEKSVSFKVDPPKPPSKPPKKPSPKPEPRERGRRGGDGSGRGADMRVAPTQQVTVTPTQQAGGQGLGALASKIDELLRNQRQARKKTQAKKAFTAAKKQYASYRKKAVANVKAENKAIKAREHAKIKKMPVKQRKAARQKVRAALKQREQKVRKDLPARVSTPGELAALMKRFRVMKV